MSKKHTPPSHVNRRQRRTTFKKHSKHYSKVYAPYLPALLILGIAFSIWSGLGFSLGSKNVLSAETDLSSVNLLAETNKRREKAEAFELAADPILDKAAQAKADDMAARNYWSHQTPDNQEPWIFLDKAGYKYSVASENLAFGFNSSKTAINGWMNSPPHKNAMLSNNVSEVGFGIARAEDFQGKGPQTIIVAMYAEPAVLSATQTSPRIGASSVNQEVSFAMAINSSAKQWFNFAAGILLGLGVMYLTLKHAFALRKNLRKSEKYIIKHPALDAVVVSVIVLTFVLSQTTGFIH